MPEFPLDIDLDLLAEQLEREISARELSLRGAATEIGCSPTTLARLLTGSKTRNSPDTKTLLQAVNWLGKSIGDFAKTRVPETSTIADVVVHLRALPELSETDKDALVAMVRALHDAYRLQSKKG
jgi:transcriptional regulator with XRE-family HTH domain